MSKKQKESASPISDIYAELASLTNGQLLSQTAATRYFINTGNLAFNYISSGKFLSGGFPSGRIVELHGESATAKSLWACNALYGAQKIGGFPVILDTEHSSNPQWMQKSSHINIDRVIRYTPSTLEECFLKMYNVIKTIRARDKEVPILIVYDSISASPCEREFKEVDLPENYTEAQYKKIVERHESLGERARISSREFRKLNGLLESLDATILIINQTRKAIGVYGDDTVTSGGKAIEFYTSQRFRTSLQKHIKNPKLDTTIGVNVKISNKKNRFFRPYAVTSGIQLLFEKGTNPVSGLLSCLLQAERIELKSPGNYKVKDEYLPNGTTEYLFKGSRERNDIPVSLLMDCPKLIDAENSHEVEDYLMPYPDFNSMFESGDIEETDIVSSLDESDL